MTETIKADAERAAPCAGLRIGDVAPDFSARSTTGDVRLSDYRGRWLILFSHFAWLRLIRDRYGVEVRFPIVEDPTLVIGRAYGMVAPNDNDSATVRTTFFIDPTGVIRAMTCYPANVGRSTPEMLRTLDALQAVDGGPVLAPANWEPGEALLAQPDASLDTVFSAKGQTDWFMKESKRGSRE